MSWRARALARSGVVFAIYQIIAGAHTLINTNSLVRELAYCADIAARHCPIRASLMEPCTVYNPNIGYCSIEVTCFADAHSRRYFLKQLIVSILYFYIV